MMHAAALFGPDAPCVCCGIRSHSTVDHQRPRSMGGTDDLSNKVASCWRCNQVKSGLERQYARKYRKADTDERREELVQMLAGEWRRHCSQEHHGRMKTCRCSNCLRAPIVFGATVASAAGRAG